MAIKIPNNWESLTIEEFNLRKSLLHEHVNVFPTHNLTVLTKVNIFFFVYYSDFNIFYVPRKPLFKQLTQACA